MRNFLVLGAMALMASVLVSEQVQAGGGGKSSDRARFIVTNNNPVGAGNGLAVLVLAENAAFPGTVAQFRNRAEFLAPGQTFTTNRLRNGNYNIVVADAEVVVAGFEAAPNTPVDAGDALSVIPRALSGTDQTISATGGVGE